MPLALTDAETTYWWLLIVIGFVVVLAVAALLSALVYLVKVIDDRVADVRDTLRQITVNTADTALIPRTADGVDAVLAEGLQHHLFLGRALAAIPAAPATPAPAATAEPASNGGDMR